MYKIDDHVACAVAGIMSDANRLINTAMVQDQRYTFAYQEPMPVEQLIQSLYDNKQGYTQFGGLCPFGVSFPFAAEAREAAKASSEKKESGKSSVFMDVKPWDDEADMKKLEEAVHSIEVEGLLWGASKLVPVSYRINKKQIMLTILDELVLVDTLIEERIT
ncbi:Elongation factor 1-delta 2 [Capsicum annuum]|uniref:Elongation factor 1-delta 2 n=1 Tax=Capsicum annuum TaxID=4072 RepID=A0A2G2Y980_CAPAN|nr:Elongation factor 1-delta 2 [Capsicum annuum]KAF3641783.1 Elongation factor 1-delta 2 [Capsicum annuum]PHT66111.1 Elongation factor 1-delta 2 [Capsicum annuum]